MNTLWDVRVVWFYLGLQLGIKESTLKAIKANNDCVEDRFREMLSCWLKMTEPSPSWDILLAALAQPSVGKEDLASQLAKKHNVFPPHLSSLSSGIYPAAWSTWWLCLHSVCYFIGSWCCEGNIK